MNADTNGDCYDCTACGACCATSSEWPRFTMEDDVQIARIPDRFIASDQSGMRCIGARCSALSGEVGKGTRCGIYAIRPDVCRTCMPGDPECLFARRAWGLPAIVAIEAHA